MYRTLLPVILSVGALAAPQDKNSDITYVKTQPPTEDHQPQTPYRESRIENLPLTIPGPTENNESSKPTELNIPDTIETNKTTESDDSENKTAEDTTENNRYIRSDYTTLQDETEPTTEVVEQQTEENELKTKAPRFLSKLSYFEKSSVGSSIATNLVDVGRRRFRSKCRCEKIWNCPKLQISVPRCPNEYFMCCF